MPQSPGVVAEELRNKNGETVYQPSAEEAKMIAYHRERIRLAKEARNTPNRKFDNLTFIQDYYSNEDAANSYLRPKKNDDEVRVVGGTTEKRLESVVNELQSMNYQHEVQAYDRNDVLIQNLGKAMEDAVSRTNQQEDDEDLTGDLIWELCIQRAVFVEEILEEKRVGGEFQRMCRKRVRSALEVIVGDPTMSWYLLQEQPFIVLYDRMSYQTAKMVFGNKKNWPHVRGGCDLSADVYGMDVTFRLGILTQDEVEVCRYMSVPDNEYQTYVNGVPMDEVGKKLPFQYPFPRYPVSCAIPKRMGHHTFYGRSMASALKYLQALNDETVRNIVRKFRQAIEPPRAVLSHERIYTRDMYAAGKISYGVDAKALLPLTDHTGVTEAETTVMNMVKSMQDELASRSDIQLGQPGKKQTATAVVEQQKQAIKMLGQIVLAYSSLVRQMTKNRIFNIIESYSEPDGRTFNPATKGFVEDFRRFTLKDQAFDDGESGDKIIQFVGRDLSSEEHEGIDKWEEEQSELGNNVRLSVVNIKKLRKMSINWYVTTASKPKDNDDLHKLMFQDKIQQATAIAQASGRQLNGERVINEWEQTWRAKDWFQEQPQGEVPPLPGQEQQQPAGSGMREALSAGTRASAKRPAQQTPQQAMKPQSLVGAV